jgi:hypothetical protein
MLSDRPDLTPITLPPADDAAAAQDEMRRVAREVAALNGITEAQALDAIQGVVDAERLFGIEPSPIRKEADKQASMNRADRRRERHEQKVDRRAAARQRRTRR